MCCGKLSVSGRQAVSGHVARCADGVVIVPIKEDNLCRVIDRAVIRRTFSLLICGCGRFRAGMCTWRKGEVIVDCRLGTNTIPRFKGGDDLPANVCLAKEDCVF